MTDPGKWLRISKKHDKQLTFIGRVMVSDNLKTVKRETNLSRWRIVKISNPGKSAGIVW